MSDIMDKWKRLFSGNADDALRAELEEWARNASAGETLDWVCAQWMGDRPHVRWFASNNGGKSGCFFDDVRGVVEDWLERSQARGYRLDHKIHSVEHWRSYSEHDPAAAMKLLEAMRFPWEGRFCDLPAIWESATVALIWEANGKQWAFGGYAGVNTKGNTFMLAIARACAVLAARGIERGQT